MIMKKTIYIFQNGKLKRKDNSLYFVNDEGERKFIPVEDTNDIYVFGEVNVNKRFLEFASKKEICIHYFNNYGYYIGTFYPREHLNAGQVILKQAEYYLNYEERLKLARLFIKGSIGQMIQVLKYYKGRLPAESEQISEVMGELQLGKNSLVAVNKIEELMAVEGHARERYYKMFDFIVKNPDFPFEKRTKRPPRNRLNALISFGNSICYTTILSEIYKTYLDPRIGFLHATNFRRFSLNLDVAEIFKPIMVDRLIFRLLNKRIITKKHFEKQTNGILLNEQGRKIFIKELDDRMNTTINHRQLGRKVSYRRLIRLELYKVQKYILEKETYVPYQALW